MKTHAHNSCQKNLWSFVSPRRPLSLLSQHISRWWASVSWLQNWTICLISLSRLCLKLFMTHDEAPFIQRHGLPKFVSAGCVTSSWWRKLKWTGQYYEVPIKYLTCCKHKSVLDSPELLRKETQAFLSSKINALTSFAINLQEFLTTFRGALRYRDMTSLWRSNVLFKDWFYGLSKTLITSVSQQNNKHLVLGIPRYANCKFFRIIKIGCTAVNNLLR